MRLRVRSLAAPRLAVLCICCGAAVSADVDSTPAHSIDLSVPGRANATPSVAAAGNRGWENTAVDRGGRVLAVWLDHRELAQQDGQVAASHHDHSKHGPGAADSKPDGVAMAQRSKLFVGSLDGAIAPRAITGGVCYCCKTALAVGPDGAIHAAWRHVYPGNIRDIAFTVSRDGGAT